MCGTVGNGWQWGPDAGLGSLAVCVNQQPWRQSCLQPPCGQLNPANHALYQVLRDVFQDLAAHMPENEAMHMGGDEVSFLTILEVSTVNEGFKRSFGVETFLEQRKIVDKVIIFEFFTTL